MVNTSLTFAPDYDRMPTSFSLKTMCRYLLQSVRPAAHLPGIVAAAILLAGCTGYCNQLLPTALGGMDNQLSPPTEIRDAHGIQNP